MKDNKPATQWALISSSLLFSMSVFGGGSLTPPGAPGPMMKSLDEIEPRTLISSLPYAILNPGSYYIAGNLTGVSGQPGISVMAPNVTIDMRGHVLSGVPGAQAGISVDSASASNLVVINGSLRGWANGVLSAAAAAGRFEALRTYDNQVCGVNLGSGVLVKDCVAERNSNYGIFVGNDSVVLNCITRSNANVGLVTLDGVTVRDCVVQTNKYQGLMAGKNCSVTGCVVDYNGSTGVAVGSGTTVKNSNVSNNGIGGIYSSGGSVLADNHCDGNTGNGIYTDGSNSRIDNNNAYHNTGIGIAVLGSGTNNLIIRNSSSGNTSSPYSIPAGNHYGQILVSPGAGFTSSVAWANFAY